MGIEDGICRFRGDGRAEYLGMAKLYPMEDRIGVYARDAQPHRVHDFLELCGFVSCDPSDDFRRLIDKAVAWGANEMVRR